MTRQPCPEPTEYITLPPTQLQQMFNEGRYWERSEEGGDLRRKFLKRRICDPDPIDGYRVTIELYDIVDLWDCKVVRVHFFIRSNLSRPDPKYLRVGEIAYTKDPPTQATLERARLARQKRERTQNEATAGRESEDE